jgi:hypothetical protein
VKNFAVPCIEGLEMLVLLSFVRLLSEIRGRVLLYCDQLHEARNIVAGESEDEAPLVLS